MIAEWLHGQDAGPRANGGFKLYVRSDYPIPDIKYFCSDRFMTVTHSA
jgi:hypothetical protein